MLMKIASYKIRLNKCRAQWKLQQGLDEIEMWNKASKALYMVQIILSSAELAFKAYKGALQMASGRVTALNTKGIRNAQMHSQFIFGNAHTRAQQQQTVYNLKIYLEVICPVAVDENSGIHEKKQYHWACIQRTRACPRNIFAMHDCTFALPESAKKLTENGGGCRNGTPPSGRPEESKMNG
nr:hypothetical protein Iba_chr14cCG13970 [Ipomoea batatas]